MKKSHKVILFVSLGSVTFIIICFVSVYWLLNSMIYSLSPESYIDEYKSALPKTATETKEKFYDAFPDFSYFMKAKITQDEFNTYTKELKLNINNDSTKLSSKIFKSGKKELDWWKVTGKNDIYYKVYYHKDKSSVSGEEYATYEDGNLYFYVIKY
jgi:hypothetical protein